MSGGFGEKAEKGVERSIEYHPFQVTESFFLPVSYGKIIRKEYKKTARKYTEQEAKLLSWEILQAYEKKLMEKGVQISANNVKIEVDHETCISKGSLEIIEKTGREVPDRDEWSSPQKGQQRMTDSIIELHTQVPADLEGKCIRPV